MKRFVVSAAGVFAVLWVIGTLMGSGGPPLTDAVRVTSLPYAQAEFDGTTFTIRNGGTKIWTSVKAVIDGGYEYSLDRLNPGSVESIGARAFTREDGLRFNPFALKPQGLTITAEIDADGTIGIWRGGWK